ncbi:MAG: uroporphyrinogen-III C-methyltransferase [Pseudomonadales bacterium]
MLWFFLLCTLGLSAAAGYGVYYLWQQWQEQQTSALSSLGELKQTQTAIIDVRDDFKVLQNDLGEESANRAAALAATQDTIELLEKTIGKQSRQMQALTQTNRDEWLLAETEYLLRLANQRILMSKESSGAMAMLQSADKILRDIDDVSLHLVRRAIANDITALRRTKAVDVDGEYLKLAALSENLDELVLYDIPEFHNDEQEAQVEATMPAQPTWQESLAQVGGSIKSTLGKVFIVRQHDKPIEAMLPPQQELYLRQNLRLMLEQAQLALLARKPATYQQSLDKAQQWIARYFIGEDAATQAALQTLADARTIDIDPPLPDISGSYHALKEYTDSAHSRKLKASEAKQTRRLEEESQAEVEDAPRAKTKTEGKKESEQETTSEEPQTDAKQQQESAEKIKPKVQPKQPDGESKQEPKAEPEEESEPDDPETTSAEEEVTAAVTEG